ncbi:MAG: GWxTD domain-containing protein, partial [Gemmatimonadota bacterium]|nr:GWxTD domain-containing protein [Gemmatimonadota bacterium]
MSRGLARDLARAGVWLMLGAAPVFAQTMPGRAYLTLSNQGHERLADRIADRLKPTANPDRGDVDNLLNRWEAATGGPSSAWDWLTVSRLWLRAGEASRATAALQRASEGISPGLRHLEAARIGFLGGHDGAADRYWQACAAADEESALESWLDVDLLATPAEVEAWDAFRRLPAGQRDNCTFLRRFWARRAAASGMDLNERIRLHYERLRFALDHYTRRGRAQEAAGSGHLNARLGRETRPVFDDRGLLYLRLGPPDETASFLGGECYEPNVSWYYRYPAGDRMYHLSPTTGVDNWWLIGNLAEVFRCPVGPDGAILQDRNPMVAGAPILSRIPAQYLREIYLSRASLDPEYARMAYRFNELRSAEELQNERDLTWSDGLYAVTGVPERPDVAQDIGFVVEWVEFRLPREGATRVWLLAAISGEDLNRVWQAGDLDEV